MCCMMVMENVMIAKRGIELSIGFVKLILIGSSMEVML